MKIKLFNSIICIIIIFLLVLISFSTVYAINIQDKFKVSLTIDYIDVSVEEAWSLLSSTENGIQTPIDIRGLQDWYNERIDTPYPEDPKRYSFFEGNALEVFLGLYNGEEVIISCYSGVSSRNVAQMLIDNNFNGTVYNMVGGFNAWKDEGFPIKRSNDPPNKPDTPSGSIIGTIGIAYNYSTISLDSDDDSIRYGWSWDGDSIVDEWSGYYLSGNKININHTWANPGSYNILVVAEDNVGDKSDFSSILSINITSQPNPPNIEGTVNGKAGQEYEYIFTISDPDNDDVSLFIDWGDDEFEDWIGPYSSYEEVIISHVFLDESTFIIRAKVKDVYDIESDWSELEVIMPRKRFLNLFLSNMLRENYYQFLFKKLFIY